MRVEKRFLAYGHDLDTDISPLQVGLEIRGIVPENRIFQRDPSGFVQRLISSEFGMDMRFYARFTTRPGKGAVERRLNEKRRKSQIKRGRRQRGDDD